MTRRWSLDGRSMMFITEMWGMNVSFLVVLAWSFANDTLCFPGWIGYTVGQSRVLKRGVALPYSVFLPHSVFLPLSLLWFLHIILSFTSVNPSF